MRKKQKKSGDSHIKTAPRQDSRISILAHRRMIVTLATISLLLGLWLLFAVAGSCDYEAITGESTLSVSETWYMLTVALIAFTAGLLCLKLEGILS